MSLALAVNEYLNGKQVSAASLVPQQCNGPCASPSWQRYLNLLCFAITSRFTMSSSRLSSPGLDDIYKAMDASSPDRAPKRTRAQAATENGDGDEDEDTDNSPSLVHTSSMSGPGPLTQGNQSEIGRSYAKKKLRPAQLIEYDIFINVCSVPFLESTSVMPQRGALVRRVRCVQDRDRMRLVKHSV